MRKRTQRYSVIATYRRWKFFTYSRTTTNLKYTEALGIAHVRSKDPHVENVRVVVIMREHFSPGEVTNAS